MRPIDHTLVLCDLDHLLLDASGNLPQLQRDVLQLFSSRGGKLTIFSQRSPRAVRSLLGGVRLSAPALVCGGTLAYNFSEGSGSALCSFEGIEETVLKKLPALQKALGDAAAFLHAERLAPDLLALMPGLVSGTAMLNAVCPESGYSAEQVTVMADCAQMLELIHLAGESVVPADAAPELRLAAGKMTLTDHDTGAAAELLYGMVRRAEAAV